MNISAVLSWNLCEKIRFFQSISWDEIDFSAQNTRLSINQVTYCFLIFSIWERLFFNARQIITLRINSYFKCHKTIENCFKNKNRLLIIENILRNLIIYFFNFPFLLGFWLNSKINIMFLKQSRSAWNLHSIYVRLIVINWKGISGACFQKPWLPTNL